MLYQGRFRPQNPNKYEGDPTQIIYRSGWEFSVMRWCDDNPFVVSWASEEIIIPYRCKTDGQVHRYFVDFKISFQNGKTFLIELKPKAQTLPPEKKPKKRQKTFLREVMTYAKNVSKWEAAKVWAEGRGITFQVWTEDDLNKLGIKILSATSAK